MCFYVNFHEISWQHDELPALPPCGTNTPISRRRESGNTTAVTCRNLRDGNQQSGEGGEAAMPNAQLTPCQSSFRCRCARLIRSRKCRDPIGDLAGNEAEHVVEALSVHPPPPSGWDHASCTALALGVDCARVATPQRPLTPASKPTATATATATASSTTGNGWLCRCC